MADPEITSTTVVIYTDGACSGNPGPGGWAASLAQGERYKEICGGEDATTNNRMELLAATEALRLIRVAAPVIVYTDSKYVRDGITSWIKAWRKNGWVTTTKQPIKNVDLWQELDTLSTRWNVHWMWVHGHVGQQHNERVDELARLESLRRKELLQAAK